MLRARSLAVFSTAAIAVGAGGAGPALAQSGGGAGDQQYQDPFAGSPATHKQSSSSAPSKKGKKNGLSQTPNLGSSGTAGTSATAPSAAATVPAASSQLPRTGSDTGQVALLGVVLLLFGIGLRLRTADERR